MIISDQDKLFTSKFWNTCTRQLGIDTRMSTSYHPQTDRQNEQTNQTMEQYLQHYIVVVCTVPSYPSIGLG